MLKKNKAYKIHGHDQACNVAIVSHLKNICILAYFIGTEGIELYILSLFLSP